MNCTYSDPVLFDGTPAVEGMRWNFQTATCSTAPGDFLVATMLLFIVVILITALTISAINSVRIFKKV